MKHEISTSAPIDTLSMRRRAVIGLTGAVAMATIGIGLKMSNDAESRYLESVKSCIEDKYGEPDYPLTFQGGEIVVPRENRYQLAACTAAVNSPEQ